MRTVKTKALSFGAEKILELLAEAISLAIIFLSPFFFLAAFLPTYNTFELPKTALFFVLTGLLALVVAIRAVFFPAAKKSGSRFLFLVPVFFVLAIGIAQLSSIDPVRSFFGSYDWQAGFLFLVAGLVFFLALFRELSLANPERRLAKIKRLLSAASAAGGLVALYACLQILGIDYFQWSENPLFTKRAIATLGQPNFLASWLLLVLPLAIFSAWENRKRLSGFFYFLVALLEFLAILASASRGALLALSASLAFALILAWRRSQSGKKVLLVAGAIMVLMIPSLWALEKSLPGRVSGLMDFTQGSAAARVNFYQAAFDAFLKKPLSGYGLENGNQVFFPYYLPDWGIYGDVGALTDKAHNVILDILLSSGLVGLLAYFALALFAWHLIRRGRELSPWSAVLGFGLLASSLSLLFNFQSIAGAIYSWFFLAILASLAIDSRQYAPIKEKVSGFFLGCLGRAVLAIAALAFAVLMVVYSFRLLIADHYYGRAYQELAAGQIFTALELYDYADSSVWNPANRSHYRLLLGRELSSIYSRSTDELEKFVIQKRLKNIRQEINGYSWEERFTAGRLDLALGSYRQAREELLSVLAESPYWPKTYFELAALSLREGRNSQALAEYSLLETILPATGDERLNPDHREALDGYRQLVFTEEGDVYFSEGRYAEAADSYQKAYVANVRAFPLLKKIADTYYLRGDLPTALSYTLRGVARNPEDRTWLEAASLLYKELGDEDNARRYAEEAAR